MRDSSTTELCCAREFVANVLPLYCGPCVRLQVAGSDQEYTVSKRLLCTVSSYFSAMLEGPLLETQHNAITLQKVEGVVSDQSLEALIQWLYLRSVIFDVSDPTEQISAAIELARLADMCRIAGLAPLMAEYIHNVLTSNPSPESGLYWRHADHNTHYMASQHIAAACTLPSGHPVRRVLAKASVEGYLRQQSYKFLEETQLYPCYGADLLAEVREAIGGLVSTGNMASGNVAFMDPISGVRVEINTTGRC